MSFEENVKSFSPLYELDIDIIEHFSVDYMHQVNVVVTKQLQLLWISGPFKIYLSSNQLEQVSSKLSSIKKFIPTKFARKPSCLQHVTKWNSTEFCSSPCIVAHLPLQMYCQNANMETSCVCTPDSAFL